MMESSENDEFTIDDFAYALAQLTDECDYEWVRGTTGLSHDECLKIMQIAFVAQKRVWG
jgi:dihydrodipicolinate reductase